MRTLTRLNIADIDRIAKCATKVTQYVSMHNVTVPFNLALAVYELNDAVVEYFRPGGASTAIRLIERDVPGDGASTND